MATTAKLQLTFASLLGSNNIVQVFLNHCATRTATHS